MIQTRLESFPTKAIPLWEVPVRTPDRPTIADVAALAGVGTGTVSRVLNGGLHVSEATRKNVLDVIERLGYRPSHLAAALSRGTPRTVAIVVPHLTRPSTVARLAGAHATLQRRGPGVRADMRSMEPAAGLSVKGAVVRPAAGP